MVGTSLFLTQATERLSSAPDKLAIVLPREDLRDFPRPTKSEKILEGFQVNQKTFSNIALISEYEGNEFNEGRTPKYCDNLSVPGSGLFTNCSIRSFAHPLASAGKACGKVEPNILAARGS